MKNRPNYGKGNRSLLSSHGSGKGSADRVTDVEKFAENFEQVKFPHDDTGFVTKGTRRVKVYRNAPEVKPPQDEKVLPILYKRPVCSGDNTDYSAHGQK